MESSFSQPRRNNSSRAEVLNRRRSLSISMSRRLHATVGISAEVLIRPYRTVTAGKRQQPVRSVEETAGVLAHM
jgi:hypothetical protein